jgi:hypothetical protein
MRVSTNEIVLCEACEKDSQDDSSNKQFMDKKLLLVNITVRESNLGGGEIFHTRPDRPWGPASLLHNGYRGLLQGR